ncbi:ATP-dependent RNA helicase DEAH11 [Colletotrichum orbiculare MAFF 240422]|uniref:RBR-type E3 ubiquitin transferase n=1 Tax=Colletotrichum orbiculare (strain 104-T / ATCC 96160 / CBS 514.97 / LARS 414 / MAFF 240422) TaxID=1213857 RepID=N4UV79_COLOR|nr:ATP-dependent RNA helicase DEAH11 [Colletotrichum orbiculare MAFF 240422]
MVKPVQYTRQILGASIAFGEGAAVKDIRLSSDFSTARIVMSQNDCTIMDVFKFLCSLGFEVPITAIRLGRYRNAMSALVRVQDPNFATALCNKIKVAKAVSTSMVHRGVYAMVCDAPKRGPTTHIVPRTFQSKVTCGWLTANKEDAAVAREIAHIQRLLEEIGPLATQLTRVSQSSKFTWPVSEEALLNSVFAAARFESAQDATAAAAKLHRIRLPFGNRPILDVSQRFSACYKVPNWLVTRLSNKLWMDVFSSRTGQMPPSVDLIQSSSTTTLRLESHDLESLHLAEKSLNISFRGTLATDADGKTPLWTPLFNAEEERRAYFSRLMQRWEVVLQYFPARKTFTIHGEHGNVHCAYQDILKGFRTLRSRQETDVRKDRTILNENHRLSCVICSSEEGEAVVIGCGHAYCTACSVDFCKQGVSGHIGWDFQCYGELDGGAECGRKFSMEELGSLLSVEFLEQLMMSSARTYMTRHPEDFRYCPTPDCECVYRVTSAEEPGSFTCPGCEKKTCTACHAEPHAGKCGEDRYIESGDMRRDLEGMEELGFKKCPKCGTFIEKTDGCLHVACHCGAHICFACLAAFKKASACTHHMMLSHEDWEDGGSEVEDGEEDDEED